MSLFVRPVHQIILLKPHNVVIVDPPGQIVLALMSVIPWCKDKFQKAMDSFSACFSEKGVFTSIAGPFILGMGMTVSGAVSIIRPNFILNVFIIIRRYYILILADICICMIPNLGCVCDYM